MNTLKYFTGHNNLNNFLFLIDRKSYNLCRFCRSSAENGKHLISECSRFNTPRLEITNTEKIDKHIIFELTNSKSGWLRLQNLISIIDRSIKKLESDGTEKTV